MASEDERSVDEQFAELPQKWQQALEEVGLGLPELRRIAAGPDGRRRVRQILSEFTTSSGPTRTGGKGGSGGWRGSGRRGGSGGAGPTAAWPWIRLLLVAVVSVAVCLVSSLFIGKVAALVGLVLGLLVIWVAFKTRGVLGARYATLAAYFVLVLVGSAFANSWYLQLRGEEQTVTIATPAHQWTHGTRETYCRVRLNDGSVHEVIDNKDDCAGRVGRTTTAVVDPSGHYKPSLGTKSDIGGALEGYICLGAAAVLILAPLTAAAVSRRPRNDHMTGAPA